MAEQSRGIAWDEDVWLAGPMSGAAHYVSSDKTDAPPVILVPDGAGDYREHAVTRRSSRRLGFQ
jgi:hypothetical protein